MMDREAVVRAVFEDGWNRESFESVSAALEEFVFHIGGSERPMTLAELRQIVRAWHVGFPDLRFDVHAVVGSADLAAVHTTLHGTHTGRWQDLDPTGRTIAVEHMFFFRFEAERIVAVWELLDRSQLSAQLSD